jgi:hypothetical protein
MKKRSIFLAVCLVLMFVSLAQALPLYTIQTKVGGGSGGPFYITGNSLSFWTFCIETQEYIYPPYPVSYYGSIDSIPIGNSGVSPAQLSDNTKKLYSYFLDNPTLSNTEALQIAIWSYQNQPGYQTPPTGNTYYNSAPGYTQTRGVSVLNLWQNEDGTGARQSMLIEFGNPPNNVPEPGILILLGLGLIGVVGIKRKFKA